MRQVRFYEVFFKMLEIPLSQLPNQELEIELNEQSCTITVTQLGNYVYFTLYLDSTLIEQGSICMPLQLILQSSQVNHFDGNFFFIDLTSDEDHQANPSYEEFGTRFKLIYMTDAELEAYANQ